MTNEERVMKALGILPVEGSKVFYDRIHYTYTNDEWIYYYDGKICCSASQKILMKMYQEGVR